MKWKTKLEERNQFKPRRMLGHNQHSLELPLCEPSKAAQVRKHAVGIMGKKGDIFKVLQTLKEDTGT